MPSYHFPRSRRRSEFLLVLVLLIPLAVLTTSSSSIEEWLWMSQLNYAGVLGYEHSAAQARHRSVRRQSGHGNDA